MGDGEGPFRPAWSWRRPFLHEVYIDCLEGHWEICSSKTQVGWLWNRPGSCSWKAAKLPSVPRMPRFEIVLDHSKKNPFFHDASTCTVSLFSGKCLVKGAAGTCIALDVCLPPTFFFFLKKNFKPILTCYLTRVICFLLHFKIGSGTRFYQIKE